MYQAYLLLKPANDFTLDKARQKLSEAFPDASFAEGPGSLAMATDDWEIAFQINEGPDVLLESEQIAEQVAGSDDALGIAACDRRVEIASDVPDPELEHLEKFQSVIDAMRSFQGTIAVDPQEPSLL